MRLNLLFVLYVDRNVGRQRGFLIALLASVFSMVAQATVVVEDASFTPTLTGQTTAVLSLRLISSEPLQLFDAKTPIAVGVRLSNYPLQDEHSVEADQAQHKKTTIAPFEQSIPIPANSVVRLDASGAHLRVIGIPGPLRVNQTVPLSLYFLDQKSRISVLRVVARVRYKALDSLSDKTVQGNTVGQEESIKAESADTPSVHSIKPFDLANRDTQVLPTAQDRKTDSVLSQVRVLDPIALPMTRPNYQP